MASHATADQASEETDRVVEKDRPDASQNVVQIFSLGGHSSDTSWLDAWAINTFLSLYVSHLGSYIRANVAFRPFRAENLRARSVVPTGQIPEV